MLRTLVETASWRTACSPRDNDELMVADVDGVHVPSLRAAARLRVGLPRLGTALPEVSPATAHSAGDCRWSGRPVQARVVGMGRRLRVARVRRRVRLGRRGALLAGLVPLTEKLNDQNFIAVDGSARAPGVFRAAANLARAMNAHAVLYRALEASPDFTPPGAAGIDPLPAYLEAKARAQLTSLAATAPDVHCELRIEESLQPWRGSSRRPTPSGLT